MSCGSLQDQKVLVTWALTEAELKKQAAFQSKARAKVVSWVT